MRALLLLLLFFGFHDDPFGECSSSEEDDDYEPAAKKLKTSCYYEIPLFSSLEIQARDPRYHVSSGTCTGELHSMAKLAENVEGNLYDAANELALVLARGDGLFLNEFSSLDAWEGEVICQHHLDELSRDWFKREFGHVKRFSVTGSRVNACGFPKKNHSAQGKRTMSHTMSKNLLQSDQSQSRELEEMRHWQLISSRTGRRNAMKREEGLRMKYRCTRMI